jgi:hypothetical protein
MRTFKLLDIIVQTCLIALVVSCVYEANHGRSAWWDRYVFIGLYQLLNFLSGLLLGKFNKLRFIYLLLLLVVFSPLFTQNSEAPFLEQLVISDDFYYTVLCPVVMLYYFTISILDFRSILRNRSEQ